mmetsp:Transcript_5020/g.7298  ORF Transcript_5020/g.7298 Transcript_5020/m.7298 type:complete len:176 (+) Transcript_5020:3-530(+)
MGLLATLALTALFESIQVLEDPFVGFVCLDGIDVREELEVLHWQQLVNTREVVYRDAPEFPHKRLVVLTSENNEDIEFKEEDATELDRLVTDEISKRPHANLLVDFRRSFENTLGGGINQSKIGGGNNSKDAATSFTAASEGTRRRRSSGLQLERQDRQFRKSAWALELSSDSLT